MKIIMDDREPKKMELVAEMVGGIEFERKRLREGDYVWEDVIVERKQIDDFCGSIMNGRFERQVEKMQRFKYKYILVSGSIKKRSSEIHEHCILGKIASLLVKHNVPVVVVDDDYQLVYLMKRIFERHEEMKGGKEDGKRN